jgi:hypothetical protein
MEDSLTFIWFKAEQESAIENVAVIESLLTSLDPRESE